MIRKAFSIRDLREETTIKLKEVNAGVHCLTMLDSGLFLRLKTSSELDAIQQKSRVLRTWFFLVDKRFEISNLDLISGMIEIIDLFQVFHAE